MVDIRITQATADDAVALAAAVRPADKAEVYASSGLGPADACVMSINMSDGNAWCAWFNDELAAVYGVVEVGPGAGVAWLLSTTVVDRYPKAFWVACKRILPILLEEWPLLMNAVDCRHEAALRWIARLGARLDDPAPLERGHTDLPFRHFELEASHV